MNCNDSHVINNGTNVYYFRIDDVRFDKAWKASNHPSQFKNGEIAKFGCYQGEYTFNVFLDDYNLGVEAVEGLIEQFLAALDSLQSKRLIKNRKKDKNLKYDTI